MIKETEKPKSKGSQGRTSYYLRFNESGRRNYSRFHAAGIPVSDAVRNTDTAITQSDQSDGTDMAKDIISKSSAVMPSQKKLSGISRYRRYKRVKSNASSEDYKKAEISGTLKNKLSDISFSDNRKPAQPLSGSLKSGSGKAPLAASVSAARSSTNSKASTQKNPEAHSDSQKVFIKKEYQMQAIASGGSVNPIEKITANITGSKPQIKKEKPALLPPVKDKSSRFIISALITMLSLPVILILGVIMMAVSILPSAASYADEQLDAYRTGINGYSSIPANPIDISSPVSEEALSDPRFSAIIHEAEKYLGYPYVWGGSSPTTSFDCSGFVCWVYRESGVYPLERMTAQSIYNECSYIPSAAARPGDLVFFTGTYNTNKPVTHIGIYVGNGCMIHAGDPIQYASINTDYWRSHFYAFGRLPLL